MRKDRVIVALLAFAAFAHAEEIDAEIIRNLDFFQQMDSVEALAEFPEAADVAEHEELQVEEAAADADGAKDSSKEEDS